MKRLAIAAAVCMFALSAQAADGQWRIGAHAAFSDFEGDDSSFPLDDSAVGFKLTGQYKINSWLGAEGAYFNSTDFEDTGGSSSSNIDLSFTGFSISGIGYIPVPSEDIEVYGKIGFFDFDVDLTADLSELGISSSVPTSLGHDDGLTVGAGAAISISESFGIRAEFDWYDVENSDLWSVGLGLEYRF